MMYRMGGLQKSFLVKYVCLGTHDQMMYRMGGLQQFFVKYVGLGTLDVHNYILYKKGFCTYFTIMGGLHKSFLVKYVCLGANP